MSGEGVLAEQAALHFPFYFILKERAISSIPSLFPSNAPSSFPLSSFDSNTRLCRGRHGVCAAYQGTPRSGPERGSIGKKKLPPHHVSSFSLSLVSLSPFLSLSLSLSVSLLLNPSVQVFVGGLSWATDDARLRQYFSNFGEVSEVRNGGQKTQ